MHIGSLGDIVFEVSAFGGRTVTPASLTRERKARFEEHQVLGDLPRLEFLAPELATASLSIHLRADMGVDPVKEADRIEALCVEGKAHQLSLGGWNFGMYVLESASQVVRHTVKDKIFSVDLKLSLKEYK